MKTMLKPLILTVVIASLGFFSSCEDDETTAKPLIDLHELGMNDSRIAYIGDDLHIDAEIIAEGKIAKIMVELHSESSTDEKEFEFIDGYAGAKNKEFHEHVEIPLSFSPGEYHFHLEVTDMEGNTAEVDADVEIKAAQL